MTETGQRGGGSVAGRAHRPPAGALAVAALLAAVVLQLLRLPGERVWDTVWLEDATVFAQHANLEDPFTALFRSYAGYLVLVPRLLAIPTAYLPIDWMAWYLALAAAITNAALGGLLYRLTRGLIESPILRLVPPLVLVLGPAMLVENHANVTNLLWSFLAVGPWLFLTERDGGVDVGLRAATGFLMAASTVLSAMFVPLAVGVAVKRRTRASIIVAAGYAVGLACQLAVVAVSPSQERGAGSARDLLDLFGLRVLGSALVGERPLAPAWSTFGEVAALVLAAATITVLVVLFVRADVPSRWIAGVMVVYAVVGFFVPAAFRGSDAIGLGPDVYSVNMTRFTILPIVMLVSAAAVLADPANARADLRSSPRAEVAARVLAAQTLAVVVISFSYATVRSDGPTWSGELEAARARCGSKAADERVRVVTSPDNFWIVLTCERVGG